MSVPRPRGWPKWDPEAKAAMWTLIDRLGSVAALARAIGCHYCGAWQWAAGINVPMPKTQERLKQMARASASAHT